MARGFESKDVESQQQLAEERRANAGRSALTPEQADVARKREGLLLQRTRILRELDAATSERHRQTLQSGLQFLDEQLAGL